MSESSSDVDGVTQPATGYMAVSTNEHKEPKVYKSKQNKPILNDEKEPLIYTEQDDDKA